MCAAQRATGAGICELVRAARRGRSSEAHLPLLRPPESSAVLISSVRSPVRSPFDVVSGRQLMQSNTSEHVGLHSAR